MIMNICELAIKLVNDEINLFDRYDNIDNLNSQYFYTLGMLESLYNISIISLSDFKKLKSKLKHEYNIQNDFIGSLKEKI